MDKEQEPPTIVEDMNIFCLDGRLKIPKDSTAKLAEAREQSSQELVVETEKTAESHDEQALQIIELVKKGIKDIQDSKK